MRQKKAKNLCIKCGKTATLGFSFDMDCTPIPTCEGCADDVREALLMMTLDVGSGGELAENYTKKWHQPIIINHEKISKQSLEKLSGRMSKHGRHIH